MHKTITYRLLSSLIFFTIFTLLFLTLQYFLPNLHPALRAGIIGGVTAMLAPRISKIDTQSEVKTQINWFVLRKSVLV